MSRREELPKRPKSRRLATPVQKWKQAFSDYELYEERLAIAAPHFEAPPPSARKLAASLWELEEMPLRACLYSPDCIPWNSPSGAEDPNCSPFSQPDYVLRTPANHRQLKTGACRGVHTGIQRLLTQTAVDSGDECAFAPRTPTRVERRRHIPSPQFATPGAFDLPTPSQALLKVFNQIRLLEDEHTTSLSFASALHEQLLEAHSRVKELEGQASNDTASLLNRYSDEKRSWKAKSQEAVRAAQSMKVDLEEARKDQQRVERLNRRVTKELAEAQAEAARLVGELEVERQARQGLEKRCEELERENERHERQVEELLQRQAEEIEEERRMLQTAEVWREERVQMKLGEASYDLQAKSAALDGLRVELEAFLASNSSRERAWDVASFRDAQELRQALSAVLYDTSVSTFSAMSSASSVSSTASCNPTSEYLFAATLDTDSSLGSRSRGRALLFYPEGIPDAD